MTRRADESEYKALSSEPANGFQPITTAHVRLESLLDGASGLPPEIATVVGDIKPQGEINLLVRPITRGLAIRLTADGEAVQTCAALVNHVVEQMMRL